MSSDEPSEVDDGQGKKMRFADILTEVPNADTVAATELLLNDRALVSLDSLEALKNLRKLELRGNQLAKLGFLEMNWQLCWLALARNRLRTIAGLQNLSSLAVLDISDNRIKTITGLSGLSSLKAFIAARNGIKRVDGLSPEQNPALETLVLSNNEIEECTLRGFSALRKLSLAHNKLHAFPALHKLPVLAELRLNGNKIPSVGDVAAKLPKLSIFDIGNNLISSASGLEPLRGHLWLKNLSLLGNACIADGVEAQADVKSFIASLPKLEILNNKRQDGGGTKKKRRREPKDSKEAAATPMEVHGRSFSGTKVQFADSDDEQVEQGASAAQHAKKLKSQGNVGSTNKREESGSGASQKLRAGQGAGTMAVHGRGFSGKKLRFADSDDDAKVPPEKGSAAAEERPKRSKRRKGTARRERPESREEKPRKTRTKKVRRTSGEGAPRQVTEEARAPAAKVAKKRKVRRDGTR